MLRFNPQADQWTQYVLPEPHSHSTTSVSFWYVDHNSYLVHIQPRQ